MLNLLDFEVERCTLRCYIYTMQVSILHVNVELYKVELQFAIPNSNFERFEVACKRCALRFETLTLNCSMLSWNVSLRDFDL